MTYTESEFRIAWDRIRRGVIAQQAEQREFDLRLRASWARAQRSEPPTTREDQLFDDQARRSFGIP